MKSRTLGKGLLFIYNSYYPSSYASMKAAGVSGRSTYSLPSSASGNLTVTPKIHDLSSSIPVASLSEKGKVPSPSRSAYIICGTEYKVKIQDPLFRNYEEFLESNSRALN